MACLATHRRCEDLPQRPVNHRSEPAYWASASGPGRRCRCAARRVPSHHRLPRGVRGPAGAPAPPSHTRAPADPFAEDAILFPPRRIGIQISSFGTTTLPPPPITTFFTLVRGGSPRRSGRWCTRWAPWRSPGSWTPPPSGGSWPCPGACVRGGGPLLSRSQWEQKTQGDKLHHSIVRTGEQVIVIQLRVASHPIHTGKNASPGLCLSP